MSSRLLETVLGGLDSHLSRRSPLYLAGIILLTAILTGAIAAHRPLYYDEIFSFTVAKQPSLGGVYDALMNGADNHPPLDYWLRHLSMALFGQNELAFRLPSILALLIAMVSVFQLVKWHTGASSAFVALFVFICSQANALGHFGRIYPLVLATCSVALLLWRYAADGFHRRAALGGLALLFLATPMLHYYAPLHIFCVVIAECVRSFKRKRIDWLMWGAFACGFLALPVILPLAVVASQFRNGFWTPVTVNATLGVYNDLFYYVVPAVMCILAVYALLRLWAPAEDDKNCHTDGRILPEVVASLWLLGLPFVIFVVAKTFTGALHFRYCVSLVIGVAVLAGLVSACSRSVRLACLGVFSVLACTMLTSKAIEHVRRPQFEAVTQRIHQILASTDLPLVMDTSQSFAQSAQYLEPRLRNRLYFLIDSQASLRIQGLDVDQKGLAGNAPYSGFQVMDIGAFLREHPHFVLVYEGGWLLQRFTELGARISISYCGRIPLITVDIPINQRRPTSQ